MFLKGLFQQMSEANKISGISARNYEAAGVSIQAGEDLVAKIKEGNPHIGGFAGLFKLNETQSLVGCTDGVGTKLELSIDLKRFEALGQDLVAMSVNDLVVCGARPLFFLDYYACGKLDVDTAHQVISGIQKACAATGCVLLGGETAEMPGFYEGNKFDLAGFAVGLVNNTDIVDGTTVVPGDVLVGLPSSGFHANGYSLIRKIIRDTQLDLASLFTTQGQSLSWGELLTEPTRLYVNDVNAAKAKVNIKAMSHITGGGLTNIGRVLPEGTTYKIDYAKIPTPEFMNELRKRGNVSLEEAFTVWNMGIGFVFTVASTEVDLLLKTLPGSFVAGEIVKN